MQPTVYTIGHSTHPVQRFVELLFQHGITAVCDVRSKPYSRFNPQFNLEELKKTLSVRGIGYIFLGKELGARSDDPSSYKDGKVQYESLAHTPLFREGLSRIQHGLEKGFHIALMCAEKEPLECHRTILVSRHLVKRGLEVKHIHEDGTLETHSEALKRLAYMLKLPQGNMFNQPEDPFADVYERQEARIAYGAKNMGTPLEPVAVGTAAG